MYIVFVATELDPALPGGAGTVIGELGWRLIEAGHRVEVLLVANRRKGAPKSDLPVTWIKPGVPDRETPDQDRANARVAAEALAGLAEQPDFVEFQDFQGLGLWALMRRTTLGLSQTPLVIRAHGPLGLVWHGASGEDHLPFTPLMEREALRMADAVVASSAVMGDLLADHYQLDRDRIRVGEPPVPIMTPVTRRRAKAPEIVAYGRIGPRKGSEELVRAALPLLAADRRAVLRFIGYDGWSMKSGMSMTKHLRTIIPRELSKQVRFEPPVDRRHLAEAIASAWMIVFPSLFETFSLAAHECRQLGLPIVLPQAPPYRPYFSYRTGARLYDGTIQGLEEAIAELVANPEMLKAMEAAPLPVYGDPLLPYRPVTPRHPRTQAGLATAAFRRIEAATRPVIRTRPVTDLADRVLDGLPESLAVRLDAQPWGGPQIRKWRRRRAAGAWEHEFMESTWNGDFPELDDPEVSVVIPCFNQGRFLHDAIRSVFHQAFDSWEIIVVDDGSTDPRTRAVLRTLHYPRTSVIRQRNQGLSAARNAGMRRARGRYLVPLDADDELAPAFLTVTVDALEAHPRAAYAHTWTRLFGNQNAIWIDRPFNPYQLLLSTSVVGCALIRADAWRQVGGYDTSRLQGNEDWDLWVRFLEHGWEQVEVPRPLFRYRQHGVSMSVTTEARFEMARIEMAHSHPGLYGRDALRAMKAEWYPWVSVVVDGETDLARLAGQTLDDLEVVVIGEPTADLEDMCAARQWPLRSAGPTLALAVHAARGKFLIDWRAVSEADPNLLEELASVLEDDDKACASAPKPGRHPTLWRRWSLLDPAAGLWQVAKGATRGSGRPLVNGDYLGAFPHSRWSIDPSRFERRVRQVRPETEGRFPDWLP